MAVFTSVFFCSNACTKNISKLLTCHNSPNFMVAVYVVYLVVAPLAEHFILDGFDSPSFTHTHTHPGIFLSKVHKSPTCRPSHGVAGLPIRSRSALSSWFGETTFFHPFSFFECHKTGLQTATTNTEQKLCRGHDQNILIKQFLVGFIVQDLTGVGF